jgi:hypothetical protein
LSVEQHQRATYGRESEPNAFMAEQESHGTGPEESNRAVR